MHLEFLFQLLLFPIIAMGPGWPVAARLTLSPSERLVTSVLFSLLGGYLLAWCIYLFALPLGLLWILPLAGLTGLIARRQLFAATWLDPLARTILISALIVTLWCVGWLLLVPSYSGGFWIADWFGHWQRTLYFLEQAKDPVLFNNFDPLTSRPPLVNVLVGAFLRDPTAAFASYQLVMTLLGCLAFLPAALLANRWGGRQAVNYLAALLMLNPLFVQNATFAWTKLSTTFFVLTAVHYFLRSRSETTPAPTIAWLFSLALALAILAHYSALPYALLLSLGWVLLRPKTSTRGSWLRPNAGAFLGGLLLLGTWFGWTLVHFGLHGTFLTSTTVTDLAATPAVQLETMWLNLRDTVVPHFLRAVDYLPLAQTSTSGWWRDWFFLLYQHNLLFAFGSFAWVVIARELIRHTTLINLTRHVFWPTFVPGIVLLGIIVHSGRNPWGVANICLQPLILIGLAYLAARVSGLGRLWSRLLVAGATLDFVLGIVLQYGAQSGLIDRWLAPTRTAGGSAAAGYSLYAQFNLEAKLSHHWVMSGDLFSSYYPFILSGLACLLTWAITRVMPPATNPLSPR